MRRSTVNHIVNLFLFISVGISSCEVPEEGQSESTKENNQLPSINIQNKNGIEWETKNRCTLIYKDDSTEVQLVGRIKYRGGISVKYEKRSYALELENDFGLAGIAVDDDWIINAGYVDKTFMRHKISYDLFREMSPLNKASKCSYIELFVDDKYEGLYVLMEEVNAGMLGLNKGDPMAMLFKGPPIFHEEKVPAVQDSLNYFQQKYPKIKYASKAQYITDFKDFLFYSSDDEFISGIEEWVDFNSFIDWQLILLLSNNGDGLMKNFYLYKLNSTTPFRIAIWDYDHSYGRDGDNEYNMLERNINCDRAILFKRLMDLQETGYTKRLISRWNELRTQGIFSEENFESHISRNDSILRLGLEANFKRWPIDSDWYFDDNDYKEEVEIMQKYISLRIPQLDRYFEELSKEIP